MKRPEGMSIPFFVAAFAWCAFKAIFQTAWFVIRHGRNFGDVARAKGIIK